MPDLWALAGRLDDLEMDRVVIVASDGTISDAPNSREYWACEVCADGDDPVPDGGWKFLSGYTGQYRYHGPVMHNSEHWGTGMAADVIELAGDAEQCGGKLAMFQSPVVYDDGEIEGWVVAIKTVGGM